MKKLAALILFLMTSLVTPPATSADWAWVLSIPHALSGEHVYKVRIVEIDGEPQQELIRYAVPAGTHTIKVRLLLQVQWEPEFAEAPPGPGVKELKLELESGRSYLLAARIDVHAPVEAQLDQSYWQPFVYRVD